MRNVLITGAMETLGQAQAASFAEAGDRLFLLDRPDLPGDAAQTDIAGATVVLQDLNDLEGSDRRVRALSAECGGIDVLVNNAALIINKPFEAFSIAEYEEQVRVNSSAAFVLAQAVAPDMKRKEDGVIVNFCSVTLNGRWDGYVPYVASKGAMLGLTKGLARELGPFGIRVNAVSPGAVVSAAEARVFGDRLAEYEAWVLENQCLKRRIQPQDVARLVLFLASAEAAMITGQNIAVDGGF